LSLREKVLNLLVLPLQMSNTDAEDLLHRAVHRYEDAAPFRRLYRDNVGEEDANCQAKKKITH
jgi:hypothetical protein